MTGQTRKKLNEKELGSLYLLSETPLLADKILQSGTYGDKDIKDFHESLSRHAPDMAMIAVSLIGNLVAEELKKTGDEDLAPLTAELKYLSVNTLEEVGRIWIDACRYNIVNEQDISDLVNESPDILCMFASILMEVAEICTPQPDLVRAIAAATMYQCEAHADCARAMIDNAHPQPDQSSKDEIPIPEELYTEKHFTDNVVTFTLFSEQSVN